MTAETTTETNFQNLVWLFFMPISADVENFTRKFYLFRFFVKGDHAQEDFLLLFQCTLCEHDTEKITLFLHDPLKPS